MTKFLNISIVLATIALVATPVLRDQFRTEIARWYLADAANRVADGLDIQPQLTAAQYWADDVTGLRDYWLLRAEQALATSPKLVAGVIQQALARDKANFDIGYMLANRLAHNGYFAEGAAVLEAAFQGELRKLPTILNQMAYFRSLAAIDLDQALKDINQALAEAPEAPDRRDTRAWVLFQMGKPQQAIDDADFAVKAFDQVQPSGIVEDTLGWLAERLASPPEPRGDGHVLTQREAGELLWGQGAVHYHRAKILEALGRGDEAQAEFDWLRQRKLPTDERIY